MSTESWVLLVVHGIIFIIVRWRLSIKKRLLEKDKAELTVQVETLQGQNEYYKRQLAKK